VLGQNVPNPFNPETWIPFKLAKAADVKIEIYDVSGRLVRRLDLGYRSAGSYWNRSRSAYWDGLNKSGEYVSSGIYFYVMTAGEFSAVRRMTILK
jgi:flagellar hook assembly protein FlgD